VTSLRLSVVTWSACTRRHVVGQVKFAIMRSKIDVQSTAITRRSNILALVDSEHQLHKYFNNYELKR